MLKQESTIDVEAVQRAFSKQAENYDELDRTNPILSAWRQQVYAHVDRFMNSQSTVLELNAGTGIDAMRFAHLGHRVHATDLSLGMVKQLRKKAQGTEANGLLTFQQCSFERLNEIHSTGFDYVFSNFGGLNCSSDLNRVTQSLPPLLKPGAYVTWVVMPPICLWELKGLVFGRAKYALRRLKRGGVMAHLEGEYFKTYYYSLSNVREAFGKPFRLIKCEGLGAISPPPSSLAFTRNHPGVYRLLVRIDSLLRHIYPINRWADHLIITLQYAPE